MLPQKYKYVPAGVLAVILIGVGIYGYLQSRRPVSGDTFNKSYSLVLKDYDDKEVHLYEFRRKVLVAYAWASWCTYCGEELKNLSQLKNNYGDDVQIVAINRAEPKPIARAYTDQLGISNILFLIDETDGFFKSIEGYAMPETVFIDSDGAILYHQRGPIQLDGVKENIDKLLQ